MRRSALVFLTASLFVHAGIFGGAWAAKHVQKKDPPAAKLTFAGETFEIAEDEKEDRANETETMPIEDHASDRREESIIVRPHWHVATRGASSGAHQVEVPPLTYGALGDRSATDVTVAIARGFPQAASTDPIWRTEAFGDAGSAILEIEIAADGTLARWSLGQGASPALRQAFVRTMAFIGGRTFIARSAVTKLRVSARVTADAVRDGDDAVYAIHSDHDGPNANAYFSLSSGRRIDLVITPNTSQAK